MKRERVKFDDEIVIRGTTYWYRGTPAGSKNRIERSLHVEKGAPQKLVLIAKKNLLESLGYLGSTAGSTAFSALAPKYIAHKKSEGLAPKTLFEVENIISHLTPFFRRHRIEEINQPLFAEYCKTKSGASMIPHRKILNQLLKWSLQNGYTKYLMSVEIPKFAKKEKRQREVMTKDQVYTLLESLEGPALLYYSMYALMGMRNSEIVLLERRQVNLETRALRIAPHTNKSRRGRVIPINSLVYELLVSSTSQNPWIFPSRPGSAKPHLDQSKPFRSQWVRALKAIGGDRHFTPHDLRAFFETTMHTNTAFTDTQREKMAGAKIDVQKRDYVTMDVDNLRGLEESVQIEGLADLISKKIGAKAGAKSKKGVKP